MRKKGVYDCVLHSKLCNSERAINYLRGKRLHFLFEISVFSGCCNFLKSLQFFCQTRIAHKVGLHVRQSVRQIVLKTLFIYKYKTSTPVPLYETMCHLMMFCTYKKWCSWVQSTLCAIRLYVQSGCNHFLVLLYFFQPSIFLSVWSRFEVKFKHPKPGPSNYWSEYLFLYFWKKFGDYIYTGSDRSTKWTVR